MHYASDLVPAPACAVCRVLEIVNGTLAVTRGAVHRVASYCWIGLHPRPRSYHGWIGSLGEQVLVEPLRELLWVRWWCTGLRMRSRVVRVTTTMKLRMYSIRRGGAEL